MSNKMLKNEPVNLQGGLTGLVRLSSIFGPLVMTEPFYYFTRPNKTIHFPGVPFAIGSVLMATSTLLAIRSFKRNTKLT